MQIKALLIDADGVIQKPTRDWTEAFESLFALSDRETATKFKADVDAAEALTLTTHGGFREELEKVVAKWRLGYKADQVIEVMYSIVCHEENMSVFRSLRRQGIVCCVASNQQTGRAQHMSENLGYRGFFDHELYSCRLGAAKPDRKFFTAALTTIGQPPSSTLFIDDREENVAGARRAGLNAELYDAATGADTLRALLKGYGLVDS
ncbi:MAG: HAD-IA family hydrolase [Rhodospirillaceae bacterium]|nr:HAD-IA family hydrolase [Rhodospirillaceae bacterium]